VDNMSLGLRVVAACVGRRGRRGDENRQQDAKASDRPERLGGWAIGVE
jgi:hypothetical protein